MDFFGVRLFSVIPAQAGTQGRDVPGVKRFLESRAEACFRKKRESPSLGAVSEPPKMQGGAQYVALETEICIQHSVLEILLIQPPKNSLLKQADFTGQIGWNFPVCQGGIGLLNFPE
mgnify:CR=1 FL=1